MFYKSIMPLYLQRTLWTAFTIVMLLSGCATFYGVSPLSTKQASQLALSRHIRPIFTEDVNNTVTVILYKNQTEAGCYIAWSNRDGRVGYSQLSTAGHNPPQDPATRPASVLYGSEYDNEIFCITLNDQKIQQQARFIKVIFDDQQEITVPITNQAGAIIDRQIATSHSNYLDVIIYDSHSVELFRSGPGGGG